MRDWDARHLAAAAGARLVRRPPAPADGAALPAGPAPAAGAALPLGPAPAAGAVSLEGAVAPDDRPSPVGPTGAGVDSRTLAPGELFVGLPGERVDGGAHAAEALAAGAWGVLVGERHAQAAAASQAPGAVLAHEDPLAALQRLARAWRRELRARGAMVVGITGSTGKTSTKDILAALLERQLRVWASPANLNTEIGLPLALLGAGSESELVVLELAMRGPGQIAELTAIAEPDVGVIVNVGPAHLELLGSLEAIAAAKAELIAGLAPGASLVVPAGERLLERHLREQLRTITFGEGGDVRLLQRRADGSVLIAHGTQRMALTPSFSQAHNLRNLLAAVAAARALGYTPRGPVQVRFGAMRGQRERLAGELTLIDDCYNANPMSMRAALDELARSAHGRRVAVLGDMLELGAQARELHREIGVHAAERGVQLLVTVGPLAAQVGSAFAAAAAGPDGAGAAAAGSDGTGIVAGAGAAGARAAVRETRAAADADEAAELLEELLREGDTVLVKGSRGMRMERVSERLRARHGGASALAAGRS
ncbi:MAG TPA: UDP-N-acetylmuramoyl-tripeptide--D-alanyl-D-alanine ligase [Solirubrobacteraceae bacterium]|nr:UDP-N-acetylmuramoyl-tripeptide--D-alanyl-D-alanine ligase [Solirubrobacteraceae bacterium]